MIKINPIYGKIILRISLSLVFLWFGINQLYNPIEWIGFVPDFMASLFNAKILVYITGSFEVIFGLLMLLGLYVRTSSLLLSLHLFGISFSLGYSALAVRDLGLAIATLAVFFLGHDKWCLDSKLE